MPVVIIDKEHPETLVINTLNKTIGPGEFIIRNIEEGYDEYDDDDYDELGYIDKTDEMFYVEEQDLPIIKKLRGKHHEDYDIIRDEGRKPSFINHYVADSIYEKMYPGYRENIEVQNVLNLDEGVLKEYYTDEPFMSDEESKDIKILVHEFQSELDNEDFYRLALKLNQKYPHNFKIATLLATDYLNKLENDKAIALGKKLFEQSPENPINQKFLASIYAFTGQDEKIAEAFHYAFTVKEVFKGEKEVFYEDVLAYCGLMGKYFLSQNDFATAEEYLKPFVKLHKKNLLFFEDLREEITAKKLQQVKLDSPILGTDLSFLNEFTTGNPLIDELMHIGKDIAQDKIDALLALPKKELATGLEGLLNYATEAYGDLSLYSEEEETAFPLHACFLLWKIKSTESLPVILSLIEADEEDEIIDFYFGDFKTECLWQIIMELGLQHVQILFDFLKYNHQNESWSLSAFTDALSQMPLHFPEKRQEVINGVKELISYLKETDNLDNIHLNTLIASLIIDGRLKELTDELTWLHEEGLVDETHNGSLEDVLVDIQGEPWKREILSLEGLYNYFKEK